MRLYIPPKSSELTLAADWTFDLFNEGRNNGLIHAMDIRFPRVDYRAQLDQHHSVTLPAGTRMKVDRIYIRSGQSDFDSITFFITTKDAEQMTCWRRSTQGSIRFWVKLRDANNLEFDENSVVSPEEREVAKVLQKQLSKKTVNVDALAITAELVLKQMGKHVEDINFRALDFDAVQLEHMAVALRATSTFKHKVTGWDFARDWAIGRCELRGLDVNDMLYGLL